MNYNTYFYEKDIQYFLYLLYHQLIHSLDYNIIIFIKFLYNSENLSFQNYEIYSTVITKEHTVFPFLWNFLSGLDESSP